MSGPRTRWVVWIVVVAAVITAGAVVTESVLTSTSLSEARPVRVPTATASTPPSTVESLAEPSTSQVPVAPPVPAQALLAGAESVAEPGMTLGVAVLDVDTGELVGRDGGRQFMSASLCKLILVVDILDQHRAEGRAVEPADLDLINRALSDSDDNAMSALWGRHDGFGAISRVADRLGLADTVAPDTAQENWGDTLTSAADMARVYRHVLRDMAPQDGAVIVNALSAATAVAADGFAQHYGLLHQGPSPRRYAKQAWVPYSPAGYLLHSAGVAYDSRTGHAYAVVLMSIQPYSTEQVARDRLSAIAAAALAPLSA